MTTKPKARQVPKSSREWMEHFRANEKPEALPREGSRLSEAEREAVVASDQEFQLGELRGQAPALARCRVRGRRVTRTICGPTRSSGGCEIWPG